MLSQGKASVATTVGFASNGRALLGVVPEHGRGPEELANVYDTMLGQSRVDWCNQHRLIRRLGSGGQGVVFLAERLGTDGFSLPAALKVFSPQGYEDLEAYDAGMARMAQVAMRIGLIQQDNLIDVHNVISHERVRILEMEWVDGYDLHRLLSTEVLELSRQRLSGDRWAYLNDVIVTAGPSQPRLKPGVAIAVLRDALAALSALHRQGILHGDIKPANLMLKRTGNAKLIDIGSAYEWRHGARARTATPAYAAPEVLDEGRGSPRSDLASLGYVLVEMLSGVAPFSGLTTLDELLDAKARLPERLDALLPTDVTRNDLLMNLVSGLVAHDPSDRFPSAEVADLLDDGAAGFQRQLVLGNLASEYENEIRVWMQELD